MSVCCCTCYLCRRQVCEAVQANVDEGMDEAGLLRVYTDMALGSIEDDFVAMGLALPTSSAEEGVPPEEGGELEPAQAGSSY